MRTENTQRRLYIISAAILLVGLSSAVLIYLTAGLTAGNHQGAEDVFMYEDSKRYRHDLEVFGGKENVIMDDFRRWFSGLWHGEGLAYTVACLSVFISLCIFAAARHMRPDLESDGKKGRAEPKEKK